MLIFGGGYIVGKGRGEDAGYKLGYHEGGFDAKYMTDELT